MKSFKALRVLNNESPETTIMDQTIADLPEGDVLVKVSYSSVNYKDALACHQPKMILRQFPMTPGIDLSGTVEESQNPAFIPGDQVLLTGYGLGVSHPGGYSQYQRVPAEWLVKLPKGLNLKQAMQLGTAGFTAALAVEALQQHGLEKEHRIFVTGASGGVGSIAIALLRHLGFTEIYALSRKPEADTWLQKLGAKEVFQPEEFLPERTKPLGKQQIDGLIDTVGGQQLTRLLPLIHYGGSAALCGNAGGSELETTVLPFILRGINLLGIDSVNTKKDVREAIWQQMAELSFADTLLTEEISLEQLPEKTAEVLAGNHQGRFLVNVGEES
ncbi:MULTISPECIES: acryloyl-CoA reductase [unclassified Enterococcus]|uniref:acrylyl-CoA reductase family protein n=1 Tax=unclassified Enterococcus TaxID=2608891 RepID=UPI003D26B180